MPLYHYRCLSCRKSFEQLVHTKDGTVVTAVQCPHCGGDDHERQLTNFVVGGKASNGTSRDVEAPFCGRCGENRPPCSP